MAHPAFALRQTVPHNGLAHELAIVYHISKGYRSTILPERLQQYHCAVQLCDGRDTDVLLDQLTNIVRSKFNPSTLAQSVREVYEAIEAQQILSPRDADRFCLTCIESACLQAEKADVEPTGGVAPFTASATSTTSATLPSPLMFAWRWAQTAWQKMRQSLGIKNVPTATPV